MATAKQRADYLAAQARKFEGGVRRGAVRLTINDDDPARTTGLDRVFVGLGAVLENLPRALESALPVVRQQFRANFQREGGREAWAALAPSTIDERLRLGYGRGPKLQRTGKLMRHVLNAPAKTTRSGEGAVMRIRPADSVGGVPKYRILALGGSRIPSRPMVVLNKDGAVAVTSAISRTLRSMM